MKMEWLKGFVPIFALIAGILLAFPSVAAGFGVNTILAFGVGPISVALIGGLLLILFGVGRLFGLKIVNLG